MTTIERVREIVHPLLADRGLELYDVEQHGPVLRVTIDRPGGIDLSDLSELTRVVSLALDEHDPVPGRYTLEVSSPGLERPLRTPVHFAGAVGGPVTVKTIAGTEGERRITGDLVAADDEGIVVRPAEQPGGERRLSYDQIERARTVFEWGPAPKSSTGKKQTTGKKTTDRKTSDKAAAS